MQQKPENQEIDLLELLAKLISTLKNNKALVILCPILGLAIGLAFFYIKNKAESSRQSIQSTMMISAELLSENEAKFLCNDFNTSDTLPGLTKQQRSQIISISTDVKKEAVNYGRNSVYISVSVVTTDENLLPALQAGLIKHFEESEPIVRQRAARKRLYIEIIKKIDVELANLEQMKYQKISPPDLTLRIADLSERKINYEIFLEEKNSAYLVKGFVSTFVNEGSSPSKLIYALIGLLAGVFGLVFILFIRFFRNYYKSYEQAQR